MKGEYRSVRNASSFYGSKQKALWQAANEGKSDTIAPIRNQDFGVLPGLLVAQVLHRRSTQSLRQKPRHVLQERRVLIRRLFRAPDPFADRQLGDGVCGMQPNFSAVTDHRAAHDNICAVSYTHLRAHETVLDL